MVYFAYSIFFLITPLACYGSSCPNVEKNEDLMRKDIVVEKEIKPTVKASKQHVNTTIIRPDKGIKEVVQKVYNYIGKDEGFFGLLLDLLLLLILFLGGYYGFRKGMVPYIVVILNAYCLFFLSDDIQSFIKTRLPSSWDGPSSTIAFLAMLVLFFLCAYITLKIIRFILELPLLRQIDGVLGVCIGLFMVAFCLSGLIKILEHYQLSLLQKCAPHSILYNKLRIFAPEVIAWVKN